MSPGDSSPEQRRLHPGIRGCPEVRAATRRNSPAVLVNRSPMVDAHGQPNFGVTRSGILDVNATSSWDKWAPPRLAGIPDRDRSGQAGLSRIRAHRHQVGQGRGRARDHLRQRVDRRYPERPRPQVECHWRDRVRPVRQVRHQTWRFLAEHQPRPSPGRPSGVPPCSARRRTTARRGSSCPRSGGLPSPTRPVFDLSGLSNGSRKGARRPTVSSPACRTRATTSRTWTAESSQTWRSTENLSDGGGMRHAGTPVVAKCG